MDPLQQDKKDAEHACQENDLFHTYIILYFLSTAFALFGEGVETVDDGSKFADYGGGVYGRGMGQKRRCGENCMVTRS